MSLSKNEKELLRRLGLGKENAKTTKKWRHDRMEINLLSNETEQALVSGILGKVGTYLERYEGLENPLGIISQREATERLEITYPTIRRWEARGLKRYTPPIADTKTVYYKVTDLLAFLGVNE